MVRLSKQFLDETYLHCCICNSREENYYSIHGFLFCPSCFTDFKKLVRGYVIKFGKKNAGAIRDTKETQKLIANSEAGKLVTHIEELRKTKGDLMMDNFRAIYRKKE